MSETQQRENIFEGAHLLVYMVKEGIVGIVVDGGHRERAGRRDDAKGRYKRAEMSGGLCDRSCSVLDELTRMQHWMLGFFFSRRMATELPWIKSRHAGLMRINAR